MLLNFLKKLPEAQAIGVSVVATLGLSYVVFAQQKYSGKDFGGAYPGEPRTTAADWAEATEAYKIFQNNNPMSRFK